MKTLFIGGSKDGMWFEFAEPVVKSAVPHLSRGVALNLKNVTTETYHRKVIRTPKRDIEFYVISDMPVSEAIQRLLDFYSPPAVDACKR